MKVSATLRLPETYLPISLQIRVLFISILSAPFIWGNKALHCVCILHLNVYSGSDILFFLSFLFFYCSCSSFRSITLSQSMRIFFSLFTDRLPSNVGSIEQTNYKFSHYLYIRVYGKHDCDLIISLSCHQIFRLNYYSKLSLCLQH